MHGLATWHEMYQTGGIATIPLVAWGKAPVCEAWQFTPSPEQWRTVGEQFRGNIGVRCGNGLAVTDGDDPPTAANVKRALDGLGAEYGTVATDTPGNRHYYLNVIGVPDAFNWARLSPDIGRGELRARNAYVVAPCSKVTRRYRWLDGNPMTLARMQPIKWRDLAFLITPSPTTSYTTPVETLPIRLVWRPAPTKALVLLDLLQDAPKGQPLAWYPSRSEAEAATVAMLVLSGWSYDEIRQTFDERQPGHYAEKKEKARGRYLALTYRKVLSTLAAVPERMRIADRYAEARAWAWPGRGLDRKAYLGVLAVGWQFGTYDVNASQRVLAEHAGATHRGVGKALKKCQERGLLHRITWDGPINAITWRIMQGERAIVPSSHILMGVNCRHENGEGHAELWAMHRLGRSAEVTWGALGRRNCDDGDNVGTGNHRARTVAELAEATGKHPATVRRALATLADFGLAVSDGGRPGRWARGTRSLAEVADWLDCERAASQRRTRHQIQREAWQEKVGGSQK